MPDGKSFIPYADEMDEVLRRPSTTLISGMIGMGKTAIGFKILELAHRIDPNAEKFVQSFNEMSAEKLRGLLPGYIQTTTETDMSKLPKGAYIMRDEAWRFANSKRSSQRKEAVNTASNLALVRQRRQHEYILIQNLAVLDVDYFRFGCNLILRFSSMESVATERQELKDIIEGPFHGFMQRIIYEGVNPWRLFYVKTPFSGLYSMDLDSTDGFYQTGLPSFWCDDISTIWADVPIVKEEEEK